MSIFSGKKNEVILLFILICFLLILLSPPSFLPVFSGIVSSKNTAPFLVVIDAGHGGIDPGKVGVSGSLEKEINLSLALKLREILEQQDIQVILTRDGDYELTKADHNRKLADMKERIALIDAAKPDLVISIHQNSYTTADIQGAQCFYHPDSDKGKTLASLLQQEIINTTNQKKIRQIKANEDYYLLKESSFPTVIVECGFLSHPEEEQLLLHPDYQRKMAWAIHLGILRFLQLDS